MEQRHCAVCGVGLKPQRRGRPRKYCDQCRPSRNESSAQRQDRAAHREERLREPQSPCVECGRPVVAKVGGGLPKRYCGKACRIAAKAKRRSLRPRLTERNSSVVTCVVCGGSFRKRNGQITQFPKHCCSAECKAILKHDGVHSCDLGVAGCTRCRRLLVFRAGKTHGLHLNCVAVVDAVGPTCVLRLGRGLSKGWRAQIEQRAWVGTNCECCGCTFLDRAGQHPESYRYCPGCKPPRWKKDKERAARAGVAYEPINRRLIFERDEYRCGICGGSTDPNAEPSTPRFPTLDHIVPIANGGDHVESNVQCACFECNWRKADGSDAAPRYPKRGGGADLDFLSESDTAAQSPFSPRGQNPRHSSISSA